ncbi:MAG: septum site-determining protein MinC [Succinimonas sp.]|nr:septum site-determining protein MinC [Succinimonas sp.]
MAITFKNGSFKGTALCLDTADKEAILAFLQEKAKYENIALWIKTNPLVLDLGQVSGEDPDLAEDLLKTVEDSGFKCTGVMETGNKDTDEALRRRGHVIVPAFKTPQEIQLEEQAKKQARNSQSDADRAGQNTNTKSTDEQKTGSDDGSEDVRKDAESGRGQPCTITGNVRSGRQVYIKNNSLTVIGNVGYGADVSADSSIFIFGAMRGRLMAGRNGDKSAVVFCTNFQPQLVSIAGVFCTMDDIPEKYIGRPVLVRLNGEGFSFEEQSL